MSETETKDTESTEHDIKAIEAAEKAVNRATSSAKADRAKITQSAQLDAAEAVAMTGIAMEADEEAQEATRLAEIAEATGDREKIRAARKKAREARKQARADHKAATKSAKQAYEAVKFSAPNKMGFMRAVQVIFAIHIVLVIVWLMLTSRDHVSYDVTNMMDWVMAILEGVAFWMFLNRFKIARPFVIGMAVIGIIVPAIFDYTAGQFNIFVTIGDSLYYIFLILYFSLSKRVKATLVNDITIDKGDYEKETFEINRSGWPFIRNLIIYFIIFSILGHWMEMGMCQFIIMGWVEGEYDPTNTMLWRDWLYPFPMEGAAVVVIALFLYPLYTWMREKFSNRVLPFILSFISNALLCSLIEFSMGLVVNADLQLWDYTNNFGNIMGQVCLQNTLAFGVAASLITWFVYPMLERWIARVPRDIMNIVFIAVAVFGAIVWSLYLITPPEELTEEPISAEEQQTLDEQQRLTGSLFAQSLTNTSLRADIEDSTSLSDEQKQRMLEEVDKIDESIKALEEESGVNYEDLEALEES